MTSRVVSLSYSKIPWILIILQIEFPLLRFPLIEATHFEALGKGFLQALESSEQQLSTQRAQLVGGLLGVAKKGVCLPGLS